MVLQGVKWPPRPQIEYTRSGPTEVYRPTLKTKGLAGVVFTLPGYSTALFQMSREHGLELECSVSGRIDGLGKEGNVDAGKNVVSQLLLGGGTLVELIPVSVRKDGTALPPDAVGRSRAFVVRANGHEGELWVVPRQRSTAWWAFSVGGASGQANAQDLAHSLLSVLIQALPPAPSNETS